MCCHVRSTSASRRRRQPNLPSAAPLPLAVLDLSKPGERQAHEFLHRATSKPERMWKLYTLRRQGDVLLCLVRWVGAGSHAKPFSVAEVGLKERAVCWRDYATAEAAREELERRCAAPPSQTGDANG